MSRVTESTGSGNGDDDAGNNVKTEDVVSKIRSKPRKNSGTIFMEFPDENIIASSVSSAMSMIAEPSPGLTVKNKIKISNETVDVPVKRGRGRPKLIEEQGKARSKSAPKSKKRARSPDTEDFETSSESSTSARVKKRKSKKHSRISVER